MIPLRDFWKKKIIIKKRLFLGVRARWERRAGAALLSVLGVLTTPAPALPLMDGAAASLNALV